MEVLPDPSGSLTLNDVQSPPYAAQFIPNSSLPGTGLDGGTVWARVRVRNDSSSNDWLLKVHDTRVGNLDVFRAAAGGGPYSAWHTGIFLPTDTREIPHYRFLFHLHTPPGSEDTIYLRFQSPLAFGLETDILSPEVSAETDRSEMLVYGLFVGAMLIIAGYNLVLFFALRDLPFLYLSLVILGFVMCKVTSDGTAQTYLWPSGSNRWTIEYSILLTMLAASLFTTTFLGLKQVTPQFHRAFVVWRIALIGVLLLVPFINTTPLAIGGMVIELALILTATWLAWRRGFRPARLFLLSWFFPLLATAIYVLVAVGVVPFAFIESNLLLVSLASLALLWSLALADRMRLIQAEAKNAQSSLASAENRYRSLFHDSHDAVFITTRAGEILDLNPAGLKLFGYRRDELAGLREADLFQSSAEHARWHERSEKSGFVTEHEALMRKRDGMVMTILISSTLWRDARNNLEGYQGILRDVTERRRTQQELAEYRVHLEELVAARTVQARVELAERERAEVALERRVQELSALNEISVTMSTVTDLAPALGLVGASIAELFCMQAVVICEISPAHQTLQLLASAPDFPTSAHLPAPAREAIRIPVPPIVLAADEPLALQASQGHSTLQALIGFLPPLTYETLVLAPLRASGTLNSLVLMATDRPNAFARADDRTLLNTVGSTIATAIENARLFEQAKVTAVATERQRLARELHDSVTQLLYSIVLLAGGWGIEAEQEQPDRQTVSASFNELAGLGQQALSEMRLLLYQLQSPVLAQLGLSGALKQRLNAVEERVGIRTTLHTNGDVDKLPLQMQAELYFIVHEALNNALRHARASALQVLMTRSSRLLKLVVQDNGIGFDPQTVSEGMGLQNMFARAQSVGAEIEIYSNTGDGTRILLLMDLPP